MAPIPNPASSPHLPRSIWILGFVSLLMDVSSEIIHSLLPIYLVTVLGASALAVGLIEGAAEGAGIGDRFLGHIERCRVLIHLIDISHEDPATAMRIVENELEAYGAGLEDKPRIVALNKIDLADAELAKGFAAELIEAGADEVFPVSGATGDGINELLDAVLGYLPSRTSTEQPGTVEAEGEQPEEEKPWSPI